MRPQSKTISILRGDSGLFHSLFEPDVLMPSQMRERVAGDKLPAQARLYRGIVDYALRDLTLPVDAPMRQDALDWIRDHRDRDRRYTVSFATAIESGYVGLDPDAIATDLLRRFETTSLGRHQFVEGRSAGKHQGSRGRVTR